MEGRHGQRARTVRRLVDVRGNRCVALHLVFAQGMRCDVRVHRDERDPITLAKELAGRDKTSIQTPEAIFGKGIGRSLVRDVLAA
jgi:hypothetical protein